MDPSYPFVFFKLFLVAFFMEIVPSFGNKGNTILLRGKYDVVEREIRCFDKCHVGLFQSIEFHYK
jgi:hypothetical protein